MSPIGLSHAPRVRANINENIQGLMRAVSDPSRPSPCQRLLQPSFHALRERCINLSKRWKCINFNIKMLLLKLVLEVSKSHRRRRPADTAPTNQNPTLITSAHKPTPFLPQVVQRYPLCNGLERTSCTTAAAASSNVNSLTVRWHVMSFFAIILHSDISIGSRK